MAKARPIKRPAPREGRFSRVALLLLLATLAGIVLSLLPRSIDSMWQSTVSDLKKREEALCFISEALTGGTLTVTGQGEDAVSAQGQFASPAAASLTVSGPLSFTLAADGNSVTLEQGENAASAPLSYALASFDASTFAGEQELSARALRDFLLVAEKRDSAASVLAPYVRAVKNNLPRRVGETVKTDAGTVKEIRYTFDATLLSAILTEWQKTLPGDTALLSLAEDAVRSLYALVNETAPAPLTETVKNALSGADGAQALLKAGLAAGNGSVQLSFQTAGGRICGVRLTWELPLGEETFAGEAALDLGHDPAGASKRSFGFYEKRTAGGVSREFSLSLQDAVADEGNAYKREVLLTLSDPSFLLLPRADGDDGSRTVKITFTRDKGKGALSLTLLVAESGTEKNVKYRGVLKNYKKGKRLEIALNRIEVDGENRLAAPYTVVLRMGSDPVSLPVSDAPLFRAPAPSPEEEAAAS